MARLARQEKFGSDSEDVAQEVVLKFLKNADVLMAKYADPVIYALAIFTNTGIDVVRRSNAQRGMGARGRRQILSGDHVAEGAHPIFGTASAGTPDFTEAVVSRLDAAYEAAELVVGLPRNEFAALYLTEVLGLTDSEAGEVLDVRRETVCRHRNKAIRHLQASRAC